MAELPETCRRINVSILVVETFNTILAQIRLVWIQQGECWSDQPHLSHRGLHMGTLFHRHCRARKWNTVSLQSRYQNTGSMIVQLGTFRATQL